MSKKIGIVSEGVSDFWVLRHIITRYLKDQDLWVLPLNPKQTKDGKQDGPGGWGLVMKYLEDKEKRLIVEALKEDFEYIVVQIDTDVCEEYGVKHDLTDIGAFWKGVCDNLSNRLPEDFDRSKLIFAVCIDEIECWLIPFVDTNRKDCENTSRCVNIVNKSIKGKDLYIDADNKNSDGAKGAYDYILKQKKKPKDIKECSVHNYGFAKFIEQLDKME
jgi:hypothetical protein